MAALSTEDLLKRVPPQDLAAEQAVLGSILIQNEGINEALEILTADDFYRESHREVFRAMVELTERLQPVDAITLSNALTTKGKLEAIGGAAYIAELVAIVPSARNVQHYAKIVREKALLRSLSQAATQIAEDVYEGSDVEELLDRSEHRIFEISQRRIRQSFFGMNELTRTSIELLERLFEQRELVTGVPTGFLDLDRITAGFQPSDLIVIAARPSMGKTALALNIAAYAATEAQPRRGVALFSLEMSKEQLALRLVCSDARVDLAKARNGYLQADDFRKLAHAASRLAEAPIFIDDSSDTSPIVLKAKCRRLAREMKGALGLVVIDYMQLMRASQKSNNRQEEISEISRSLKGLAKELRVPVIALSQLNRQVETRPDRRPLLADLRESGAIEQDADVIAFIYRDEFYHRDTKEPGVAEVIVAKQRNGPTDTAKLTYISQYTRFENYTSDDGIYGAEEN